MLKRRVVITGIGTVNALGHNVNEFWENARNEQIGIDTISSFDTSDYKVKVAAEVKELDVKIFYR